VIVGGGGLGREFLTWSRQSLCAEQFRFQGCLALQETPAMGDLAWRGDEPAYHPREPDLPPYKIPVKITLADPQLVSGRFRKMRRWLQVVGQAARLPHEAGR
jgi:hypothetical protein